MKILIADKFPGSHAEMLREQGHELTIDAGLEGPTLPGAMAGHEVLIVRSTKVTAAAIDAADALKLIIRAGSGYNTIDFEYAATKGIAVCNTPGMNAVAVAEVALGLMIAVDRSISQCDADAKLGVWAKKAHTKTARGLKDNTLGMVGIGIIGSEVVKRALAFDMKVLAYDPYVSAKKAAELGVELVADKLELAARSDFVSVHVPKTAATTHLIDADFLAAMPDDAVLIHTARGGVVDDAALLAQLDRGRLRAGLDVYEDEPAASAKDFPGDLPKHPRVIATHHVGASTQQAQTAVADEVLEVIAAYAAGEDRNKVN